MPSETEKALLYALIGGSMTEEEVDIKVRNVKEKISRDINEYEIEERRKINDSLG